MTIPWSAEISALEMRAGLSLQKTNSDILAYCRVHLRAAYTAGLEAGYKAADRDDAKAWDGMVSEPDSRRPR